MVANATISPLASTTFSKLFKLATNEGIQLDRVKFIICWKLSAMTPQWTLILSFYCKRFFFQRSFGELSWLASIPYLDYILHRKMNIIGHKGRNTHLFHGMKKWAVKGRKPLEYCDHVTTLHEYLGTLLLLWKAFFVRFFVCIFSLVCTNYHWIQVTKTFSSANIDVDVLDSWCCSSEHFLREESLTEWSLERVWTSSPAIKSLSPRRLCDQIFSSLAVR